jgi:hypothetical protein
MRMGVLGALTTVIGKGNEPAVPTALPDPSTAFPAPSENGRSEQRVILLLRTPGDEDTISRLRPELEDGGWQILEIHPSDPITMEPVAVAASRERVAAAVRVDFTHGSVELWVRRAEGSITETFTASGERSRGRVLAVRVAEALRARGLLLPPKPEGAEEDVEHRAQPRVEPKFQRSARPERVESLAPDATARHPPRFSVELGAGLAMSPGGLSPLVAIDLGLRLALARIWSITAVGMIPVSRQSVRGAEGEALVSSYVVGGLVELEWARLSFGGFRSGLGAGSVITPMAGRGAPGFRGIDDTVIAFAPLARTSFHVNLGTWLRLRTALVAGATFPAVRVAFDSREAASWGRPFGMAGIALEASSP